MVRRAWQRMLSGRRLDLLDPTPVDIEVEDIAHGLAFVARWNGQTLGDWPYSVAEHSLLVEQIFGATAPDPSPRWRLAALLHDAAREMEPGEFLRLAGAWDLDVGEPERQSPKLLHAPAAAELARRELGVEDEEVLGAIRAHTTGHPGMGPLALALYVADKIEPARDYPSVERLRGLASEDLRMAAAEALRRAISYNEGRGRSIHPDSRATLEWLEET